MSNIAENKKYLNLDEVRISYKIKDDSIHITSSDEDLTGSAFHLTLNKNSESEQILRKLLIEKGLIRVEPISLLPSSNPLTMNPQTPANEFILGSTEEGNAIWDTSLHAHALILGNSSSLPKLTRNLFAHCLTHNSEWQFYGINLNQAESSQYDKFNKTVTSNVSATANGIKMINDLVTEMNKRYSLMNSQRVTTYSKLEKHERNILFVLDEATRFMSELLNISHENRKQTLDQFTELLRLGRAAGIHVALSTQRMDTVLFPEAMRAHFKIRIAAERLDVTPSVLLLGSNIASRLPKNTKGRGLLVTGSVEQVFQTAFSTEKTLTDWVLTDLGNAEPTLYDTLNKE